MVRTLCGQDTVWSGPGHCVVDDLGHCVVGHCVVDEDTVW